MISKRLLISRINNFEEICAGEENQCLDEFNVALKMLRVGCVRVETSG